MNSVSRRELLVHGFCREAAEKENFHKSIPDSVLLLIVMNHPQLLIESNIITTAILEDQLYDILCAKIGASSDRFTLHRLFNSRVHGLSAKAFHTFCDDSEYPTIILAKSKGYNQIFGGYATKSFKPESHNGWTQKTDPYSFLFTFSKQYQGYKMKKKDRLKNISDHIFELNSLQNNTSIYAIRCNYTKGPVFGNGCDLFISDDGTNSYCSPDSYDIPNKYILAGNAKFDVGIYEVFELKQPNWNCEICTFENKGSAVQICHMCFQPRGTTFK